jgi:two-component system, cell cycle sensor histidine kinase and response regulator CckA
LADPRTDVNERKEVASELEEAVERAGSTARQLLSFAKRNVEEIGECSPVQVLARLHRESSRLVPAHIELQVQLEDTPKVAIAGPALEQIVLNLVQNARDAMEGRSGVIEVKVSTDQATGGMLLSVADTGPGMSPEVADQAFEPFFTTKGDQGAGLGLATVWGIIRRHGGEVSLDTELGRGTRVHLYLPSVTDPESQRHSLVPATHSVSSVDAPRILILEDELPVRSALRRIFAHIGFDVVEAGTVDEARQACRKHSFQLLLSDGVVPNGGVGGFIQEFSSQFRRAPVILCSGYLEEDLALQGVAQGKCAFLAKPFTVHELTQMVRTLLPAQFEQTARS